MAVFIAIPVLFNRFVVIGPCFEIFDLAIFFLLSLSLNISRINMGRFKEFDEQEALDKAIDLFCRQGYEATSAEDLVNNIGLSRSSLYRAFTDKKSLFIKCLEKYSYNREEVMSNLIEQSNDIPATIKLFFQIIVDQDIHLNIPRGCLIVNTGIELASHDSEIAKIVSESNDNMIGILEKAIKKGQQLGQISKQHSPSTLANFVFNNISGVRISIKSKKGKEAIDDAIRLALSILK